MEDAIISNIDKLRSIYLTPIDQRDLTGLEHKVRQLAKKKRLKERSEIQEFIKDATNKVKEISSLLSNDEKLTEEERKGLFAERRVHLFWLDRLDGKTAEATLNFIRNTVDNKLTEK